MQPNNKNKRTLNYNHLYYFYVTAKCGGVTRAAAILGLSQPSLSSQLKILEERVKAQLFIKEGRVNVLTPDGTDLFKYTQEMFDIVKVIEEQFCYRSIVKQHNKPNNKPLDPIIAGMVQAEVQRVLKQKFKI